MPRRSWHNCITGPTYSWGTWTVAVIAGYLLFSAGEEHTDDAQVTADMVPVAARVGGQVVHVAIIENQHVEAGALIAQIDDRDYAARLAQAQAELQELLASAVAGLARVLARSRHASTLTEN